MPHHYKFTKGKKKKKKMQRGGGTTNKSTPPRLDPILPNVEDADLLHELGLVDSITRSALKNIDADSISYRTNNPLNITDRVSEAIGFEQPKDGDAPIAMFDNLATGMAAGIRKFKNHQLGRSKWAKPDMTIEEYQKTYATSPDSFKTFQKAAKNHGYDIKASDKLGEVMDNMGMEDWMRTMVQKENGEIYSQLSQPGVDIFKKVTEENYREFLKQDGGTVESLMVELSKDGANVDEIINNFRSGGFVLQIDNDDKTNEYLKGLHKLEDGGTPNPNLMYVPMQYLSGGPVHMYGVEKAFLGGAFKAIGKGIGAVGKAIGKGAAAVGKGIKDVGLLGADLATNLALGTDLIKPGAFSYGAFKDISNVGGSALNKIGDIAVPLAATAFLGPGAAALTSGVRGTTNALNDGKGLLGALGAGALGAGTSFLGAKALGNTGGFGNIKGNFGNVKSLFSGVSEAGIDPNAVDPSGDLLNTFGQAGVGENVSKPAGFFKRIFSNFKPKEILGNLDLSNIDLGGITAGGTPGFMGPSGGMNLTNDQFSQILGLIGQNQRPQQLSQLDQLMAAISMMGNLQGMVAKDGGRVGRYGSGGRVKALLKKHNLKGVNKPKRTPNHPTKSHMVLAKEGDKTKLIRFGEQGAKTAGKPKPGESERMKKKRASFKARHAKNIAKGKMSAAFWANKSKWQSGGPVNSPINFDEIITTVNNNNLLENLLNQASSITGYDVNTEQFGNVGGILQLLMGNMMRPPTPRDTGTLTLSEGSLFQDGGIANENNKTSKMSLNNSGKDNRRGGRRRMDPSTRSLRRQVKKYIKSQEEAINNMRNNVIDMTYSEQKQLAKDIFNQQFSQNATPTRDILPKSGSEVINIFGRGGKVNKKGKKSYQQGGKTVTAPQPLNLQFTDGNLLLAGNPSTFSPLAANPQEVDMMMMQELLRSMGAGGAPMPNATPVTDQNAQANTPQFQSGGFANEMIQRLAQAGIPNATIDSQGVVRFQNPDRNIKVASDSKLNSLLKIEDFNSMLRALDGGGSLSKVIEMARDRGVEIKGTNPSRSDVKNAIRSFVKNDLLENQVGENVSRLIDQYSPNKRNVMSAVAGFAQPPKDVASLEFGGSSPVDPRGLYANNRPVVIPSRELTFEGLDLPTAVIPIPGQNAVIEMPLAKARLKNAKKRLGGKIKKTT